MSSDALFDALDTAAIEMLKMLGEEEPDSEGTSLEPAERVKVFSAVVDYAKLRADKEPPKLNAGSKFNDLKDRFHGNETSNRTRRGRPAKAPSGGGNA